MRSSRSSVNAARSRRTSSQMRMNAYGTHHGVSRGGSSINPQVNSCINPQVERMSRHSGNAAHANISNQRHARRATRGYVDQIIPTTKSGESAGAYSRRMSRQDFGQEIQRKSCLKRMAFILAALVLIVGIGAAAAYFAFFASVDAKLSTGDDKLSSSLVAQKQGEPFYALLCADLNDTNGNDAIDVSLLVRFDETANQATLIAIPGNVRVATGDAAVSLSSILKSAGASGVVDAVSALMGVDISHYVHTDKAGFVQAIDDIGGVDVSVAEVVDDPEAGSIYISPGEQTLDGAASAVFLSASNYKKGVETKLSNQLSFAQALASKFFADAGGFSLDGKLDDLASHLSTDMTARELQGMLDKLHGMNASNLYTAQIDGYEQKTTEHGYTAMLFVPSTSGITSLMASVDAGANPSAGNAAQDASSIDKESFEITVRNGSGITGGATALADILTNAGYIVAETGNADSYVYTETLVIYLDSSYKQACESIVQTLGTGRVVNGVNGYTFDTEVLVVLGSDWKPLS